MKYLQAVIGLLIISLFSFQTPATYTINGVVSDAADGSPIKGAAVSVRGSSKMTTTGPDGSFSISINGNQVVLICTAIGYGTQEIKVTEKSQPLNIRMRRHENMMSEVVAIGYGTRKKSSVAGIPVLGSASMVRQRYSAPARNVHTDFNTEGYDAITENRFLEASENPLSTFSIDVDAASYSNVRRFLKMGQLPPAGSVRIEEMINYFHYDYPQPTDGHPFSINTEIADCPWNNKNKIVLVGLQGKKVSVGNLPASNLVFLIDVSGSMAVENKLPLVKSSMKLLVDQLREQDKVSIVVYAGNAGLVLPPTSGAQKQTIKDAIDRLESGGSTAGGAGIKLAYKVGRKNLLKDGNNRVILCTDGDFNIGMSSDAEMEKMIEEERASGIYLTVLGYGMGNYKDNKMQKLAGKGNGNHAYIDNITEARKVLVSEFGGTLFTIAKDVKLQVEFNPAKVKAYRLIGYENRMLAKEDFNNDKKDAGELGSGHTVTALYEVIPVGVETDFIDDVDPLKYQRKNEGVTANTRKEIMTIKFRYKKPEEEKSRLIELPINDSRRSIENTSDNFRFAVAIAQYGMLLRDSEFRQGSSFANARKLAENALGRDQEGYRHEFLELLETASRLKTGVE